MRVVLRSHAWTSVLAKSVQGILAVMDWAKCSHRRLQRHSTGVAFASDVFENVTNRHAVVLAVLLCQIRGVQTIRIQTSGSQPNEANLSAYLATACLVLFQCGTPGSTTSIQTILRVLLTDEATFRSHVHGVVSGHSLRIWGDENSHVACELEIVRHWTRGEAYCTIGWPDPSYRNRPWPGASYLDMLELYALSQLPPETVLQQNSSSYLWPPRTTSHRTRRGVYSECGFWYDHHISNEQWQWEQS